MMERDRAAIRARIGAGAHISLALLVACAITVPTFQAQSQTPKADTAAPPAAQKAPPLKIRYDTEELPRAVMEVREALLAAIEAGQIEELRHALDVSDVKPDTGAPPKTDAIAHWKSAFADTQGREVLAALSLIMGTGYVAVRRGSDIENNQVYVWPYFAEMPLGQLNPRQEVELLRLVPVSAAREMKEKGKYTGWRLVIGADGTWRAFRKGE
jgi:hypothetical protein